MNRSTGMDAIWLTQAHFGVVGAPLPALAADPDPDDELLPETPPDVKAMLGFDPLDYADAMDATEEGNAWEYYDYDNTQYRRPSAGGGPLAMSGVTDVLAGGQWVAYGGRDRTAPHIYGDPIPGPLRENR